MILDTNGFRALADGDMKLAPLLQQAPALARQHNSPLVTRDQHFDFIPGLTRLNW